MEIQQSAFAPPSRSYRILPQKEFLQYADPFFYEDTCGTRQMEEYLTDNLGISQEDAEGIVAEMVFVCRCGASPTLVQDALTRRGLPFGRECYLDTSPSHVRWSRRSGVGRLLGTLMQK